jgi:TRAP-type mannitol/chloroaromatic compound transport system permease small subunit
MPKAKRGLRMHPVRKFIQYTNGLNRGIGYVFCWILFLLMGLTVLEVIMRRFVGSPTIWSFETCTHLYGMHFMITAAYTLQSRAHVSVDIVYAKFSKRKKALIDVIGYCLFFFPFTVVLFWWGSKFAWASWSTWETSWSVFAMPLYPLKTMIPVTAALLFLQGAVIFIQQLYLTVTGKELVHD